MLKTIILESIIKAFLRDLSDFNIRRKTIRNLASSNRSLLNIYNLTNEARRIKLII